MRATLPLTDFFYSLVRRLRYPMSIWYYEQHYQETDNAEIAYRMNCVFCGFKLVRDYDDEQKIELFDSMNYGMSDNFATTCTAVLGICPACGWWKYGVGTNVGGMPPTSFEIKFASLRTLDLTDKSIPIGDIRAYLTARYESRFEVHPRVFEEVVASVFRDHGFKARATAYSGDGGIDVVLDGPNGSTIGVQVKRYKNRIAVDQIRELTGALVIEGHTRGIFVTTSEFQAGASATARRSAERGYPIELQDASAFLEALEIAQVASAREIVERKPWGVARKWNF